jgi:hypothetical protein
MDPSAKVLAEIAPMLEPDEQVILFGREKRLLDCFVVGTALATAVYTVSIVCMIRSGQEQIFSNFFWCKAVLLLICDACAVLPLAPVLSAYFGPRWRWHYVLTDRRLFKVNPAATEMVAMKSEIESITNAQDSTLVKISGKKRPITLSTIPLLPRISS